MISYHEAEALRYIHKQRGKATEKRVADNVTDGELILARMFEIGAVEKRADGTLMLSDLGRREIQTA